MKFLTIASVLTLSSSALAAIREYQLFAQSDNEEVNGQGLSSIHEGAGINYVFLGSAAQTVNYDTDSQNIFADLEIAGGQTARQSLVLEGGVLQLSVAGEPLAVQIADDGAVTFPGSDGLAAAKNINDPYRYSENSFAVISGEGIPISIVAKAVGEPEQEEESSSSVVASTTEAPSSNEGLYSNVTTTHQIVTEYVTYCPESTTLTLTVCEEVCKTTEIATSGSVTVSNVKVPTETPEAPKTTAETKTTAAVSESKSTSVEKPTASVTSFEGAANVVTGSFAVAVAAAIGLMF
ncbi:putative cell wall protein, putative [Candida maltosa Xu316]|uniref:Putative cell wall protein, putative n=1 Tax=Candida maltosa (strain Xu316) TaxID=1245528 RepID=M3IPF5_CANMX|nr:putative cell wall protein, putative [Candida maltosa Xu316]